MGLTAKAMVLDLLTAVKRYGTIGVMNDHRVRLDDQECALIVAALNARMPMMRGVRRARAQRLVERLTDMESGNPNFKYGMFLDRVEARQTAAQKT